MDAPTIADTPAPDLTGLDQFKPPGMPDLNANVASAEGERNTAMGNLDTQIGDVPQAPQPEADNRPAPQRNVGGLMAMSPWLIALSTFGGSRTKLSANNMLASTTGMINGLVSGDDQRYQEAYDKWQTEHKQFAEMQKQKWDIYKEMVKVYKDQIDGKQRALQVAEAAVRDARKDRADAMSSYLQTIRASMALRDESRKWAALDEEVRSHKANEKQKAEDEAGKTARASGKTSDKAKKHTEALSEATTQIDDLVKMLDAQATKGPGLGITGMGGMVKRGLETAGNVTGLSDETTAHDFESKLSNLQLAVAPLLAGSRTAKDQREKIEKVVRGLKSGDTRQSTKSALLELKKQLQGLQPETGGEHGAVVKEGTYNGKKVVQYEDGTVDYAQ
jgi:hypothetical protein